MKMYQVFVLIVYTHVCYAHLPRLVFQNSLENPIAVSRPEVSQAFYGRLDGEPHFFKIESKETLPLYLNILVPETMGARIDFVVDIMKGNETIFTLKDGLWTHFYERFAGDNYIRGPEFEQALGSGTYTIKVSNEDNWGYYILAIGKKERFSPSEIINLYRVLPGIKEEFFQKSPLTAYFNLFTLLFVFLVASFVWLATFIIIKIKARL